MDNSPYHIYTNQADQSLTDYSSNQDILDVTLACDDSDLSIPLLQPGSLIMHLHIYVWISAKTLS